MVESATSEQRPGAADAAGKNSTSSATAEARARQPKTFVDEVVEEARELERLQRELQKEKCVPSSREQRKHGLDWLGGVKGVRETMLLQGAYGIRLEFDGRHIRLPCDAFVFGQIPFIDRDEEAKKAVALPENDRDRALQTPHFLQPDSPTTNWEHWFRLFEAELLGRHVSREKWPEMLVNRSSFSMRQ